MENQRPLKDIFADIEKLAEKRRLTEYQTKAESSEKECHCENGNALYFKWTNHGRKLAVCPHCHPKNTCKKCGSSGHLKVFNSQTLTDDIYPNACECMDIEKCVQLYNDAGIPDRYLEAHFGKFNFPHFTPAQVDKYMRLQEVVYNFCNHVHKAFESHQQSACEKAFLLLMGPVGTGKTHLACAALKQLSLHFGLSTRFIDFQALLARLRDAYAKKTSEEEILSPLRNADVLLIDEFGKGRTENEWQLEKLDDLVNSRYNARKITIATTNYLTPELLREWHKTLTAEEKKTHLNQYSNQTQNFYAAENKSTNATESFWSQSLLERIGARMYDRMTEEGIIVDFVGLTSFRKAAAKAFIEKHQKQN